MCAENSPGVGGACAVEGGAAARTESKVALHAESISCRNFVPVQFGSLVCESVWCSFYLQCGFVARSFFCEFMYRVLWRVLLRFPSTGVRITDEDNGSINASFQNCI